MADRDRIEAQHRAATTGDRPREGDDPDTPTRAEAEADERRTDPMFTTGTTHGLTDERLGYWKPSEAPVTRWFSFGYDHRHEVGGIVFDAQTIARVTALDPRAVMLRVFGREWCWEYQTDPTSRPSLSHMAIIDVPVPKGM